MSEEFMQRIATLTDEINSQLSEITLPKTAVGLYKPLKYSLESIGKRIRPLLVLIVGESLGGEKKNIINAALAVEILHTFTLVHDDIIDHDTQRRNRPTIHVKWDVNTAILTGDALMTLSFRTLMQTESPYIQLMGYEFSQAMLDICEGQALDIEFEKRNDVTTEEYLNMVGKKTGRMLGLSCLLGALSAGSNPIFGDDLSAFGLKLGQAFQIQDDILEITSDEKKMGKSLFSDIGEGKKTFPVVEAISGMTQEEKQEFLLFLRQNVSRREIIKTAFEKRGILGKSYNMVKKLISEALSYLVNFPEKTQHDLNEIVRYIQFRQS